MAIQVNIFEAGSVPTAQELATLINELNTTLDESVTLTGEQSITGVKTFLGSKLIKFKQSASADKLGFTLYDYQSKEVGNFEYDNKSNFRLLALGNYVSAANQEVECNIGFKIYNKLQGAAYRLLCPLAGNAKNSIPSLTDTYTNFYMPLVFTNGAASVMADNNGKVDLSTLIGSGGGSGDVSGLATVATTGDYNDLLNKPVLFSGSYNDLTNKPTLFSGSYGDLTNKPTLFSGDYNDLTNKPTIPTNLSDLSDDSTHRLVTDTEKSTWNNKSDFSGSYNDLTNKPTIPTVPAISTNITTDATSDTKTASPKAVKDFVEGKGYLTEHQDISGKANQNDLEALEDRVEALEQGGGDTTQYSYLKLVPDLDAYIDEAPIGEIVKYIGQTNNKYTRGWDYEKVVNTSGLPMTINSGDVYMHDIHPVYMTTPDNQMYKTVSKDIPESMQDDVNTFLFQKGGSVFKKVGTITITTTTGGYAQGCNIIDLENTPPQVGDTVICITGNLTGWFGTVTNVNGNYIDIEYIDTSNSSVNTVTVDYSRKQQSTIEVYNNAAGCRMIHYHSNIWSLPSSGSKNVTGTILIFPDDNCNLCVSNSSGAAIVTVADESITIEPVGIASWQPIIMPSSNNIQTDVELSSSSHYPVENATLYDELRVEEAGSVLSVNSTNYPIVELDATDFDVINFTGADDTDWEFKKIPVLDSNKAYIIKNANFSDSNNDYSFSNQGTFLVKFQPSDNLGQYASLLIGHNDTYKFYEEEETEFNKWLSIPATEQFNVTNWGTHLDNDTTIPYYGTPYEDGGSSTITELTNATETTGSTSVIKSLKAKVMELEAQIAQISAQLQNIASN